MTSVGKQTFLHLNNNCKHGENQKEMQDLSKAEDS